MNNYRTDRTWSDQFIPTIKAIVGPYLLEQAPLDIDQRQATDLIILNARDKRIACRVRRPGYAERYPNEFTIRSKRDSGAVTELSKIIEGFGDWMFYGHADADEVSIDRWMLIDLDAFRDHLAVCPFTIKTGEKPNYDGTYFQWYDATTFIGGPPILIADSTNDYAVAI